MKSTTAREKAGTAAAKALFWSGAFVGALALANAVIFYRTPPLTSELDGGDVRYYPTPMGDVFYRKAGQGPPLLLVHGFGAGESSYEFRRVWKALAARHTVYALDLIGFGQSDKPRIDYDADTYISLISNFVRDVIGGPEVTDVIATSLSAAYVVTVAEREPALFRRLVLICPTGIDAFAEPVTTAGAVTRQFFRIPVLGTTIYNLIAGKPFIRWYLQKMVYAGSASAQVTDDLVTHYHVAAHQPGGERVLPSFVSGYLNASIAGAFRRLSQPVLIVWGRSARQTPLPQSEPFLLANPEARLSVIEGAGMLPQDERPNAFLSEVVAFLA